MKKTPGLLSLFLFIVACSPGSLFESSSRSSNETSYSSLKEARSNWSKAKVFCGEASCPPFVGGLFHLHFSGNPKTEEVLVGQCSGTLIAADRVLTNAHCVPKDIQQQGSNCFGRIRMVFPNSGGFPEESLQCDRVELISVDTRWAAEPDYAVLKMIGSTARPFAPRSFQGLAANEKVQLLKVDVAGGEGLPPRGVIRKAECLANSLHGTVEYFLSPKAALFNLSDCDRELDLGNSGSGVFSAEGKLIGLHSFALKRSLYEPASIPDHWLKTGGGTNLACIPFADNPNRPPRLCAFEAMGYSPLAIVRTLIRRQEAHAHYQERLQFAKEQASEKISPFLRGSSASGFPKPLGLLEDDVMGVQRTQVIRDFLGTQMPVWPECIEAGAPASFASSLVGLEPGASSQEGEDGHFSRESEEKVYSLVINQVNPLEYEMEFSESPFPNYLEIQFLPSHKRKRLNMADGWRSLFPEGKVRFTIPTCEALAID